MNYSLKLQLNEVFFYVQFSVGMHKFSVGMHKFSVGIELIKNHFSVGQTTYFWRFKPTGNYIFCRYTKFSCRSKTTEITL
jgi:hypothetical protein